MIVADQMAHDRVIHFTRNILQAGINAWFIHVRGSFMHFPFIHYHSVISYGIQFTFQGCYILKHVPPSSHRCD